VALSQMTSRAPSALLDTSGLRSNAYRLWLAGGVIGLVLLLGCGWFFLIRPQTNRTSELRAETESAQDQVDALRTRLNQLRSDNAKLDQYRQAYRTARQALPTTAALSTFLRDVQGSGTRAGVSLSALVIGAPSVATGVGATIYSLPVTITAAGTASKLDGFLNQLQRVQPRAVLISTVNAVPNESNTSLNGSILLTLGMQAFVAPATIGSALTSTGATSATTTTD